MKGPAILKLDSISSGKRRDDHAETFLGTDRFLIQRRLGSGAFGVVYEAYDRQHDGLVALKVLRYAEADALYRFKKGFRSLADIRHPNLVTFYELLAEEGQWFLTLELVDGVDFISHLRARRGDYDATRDAVAQLARGLRLLHTHGKLHRDIKPPNVLMTRQGRVVLLDFGMVAELGPSGQQQSAALHAAGTPAYMSPELAQDELATPASDWYSVGVMLYETLVGALPFDGSLLEILQRKKQGLDHRLRDLVPNAPKDLAGVCEALLAPTREQRLDGDGILRRLAAGSTVLPTLNVATTLPLPVRRTEAFVGRGEALAALRQALEASRRHAVTVLLHGDSGMGKSALVRHFLEGISSSSPESVVLAGRCFRQESVPYKAVDSLIDALSRHLNELSDVEVEALLPPAIGALARLFPVLARVRGIAAAESSTADQAAVAPQTRRRRAFCALRALFEQLADRSPVVLLLDDLHWGDIDSVALLDELLRPPRAPNILVIACYRSDEAAQAPFLQRFAERRTALEASGADVRELPIVGLEAHEAEALAASMLRASQDDGRVAAMVREAGGSPLFLTELAKHALGDQGRALDVSLNDVIAERVARLPEFARRLLEVVAVAGRPVDLDVVRQASGLGGQLDDALAALRGTRLVLRRAGADSTGSGHEVEPFHDRVRETVVAGLDADLLRRWHQALAVALESSGRAAPETLAAHFRMTEDRERAGGYAASAAAQAEKAFAFERAARLYRQALDLLPPESGERFGLVVKLAAALANAGHSRESAEAYLQAVGDAGFLDPLELQRNAAEKLLISGHIDRGLSVLRHVLRSIGMSLGDAPSRLLLELWWRRLRLRLRGFRFEPQPAAACDEKLLRRIDICWSVETGLCLVDILRASVFHVRHLELALRAGEPQRVARGLAMEVFFAALEGGDRRRSLDRAAELADRSEGTYAVGLSAMAAGMLACSRGAWAEAGSRLDAAARDLHEVGAGIAWELDTVEHFRSLSRLQRGAWGTLFAELPDLLKHTRERGDRYLEVHLRIWVSFWRDLAADQPAVAVAGADRAIGQWSYEGFHFQHFGHLMATVQAALYRGAGSEAATLLNERWRSLTCSMVQRFPMIFVQTLDLRARCSVAAAAAAPGGSRQRSRRLRMARRDIKRLGRDGEPWPRGLAAMAAAGVASVRGQHRSAVDWLWAAEKAFRACDMRLHAAVARRRRGTLLADEAGNVLVAEADTRIKSEGVRRPERLARVLAPGRWSDDDDPNQ